MMMLTENGLVEGVEEDGWAVESLRRRSVARLNEGCFGKKSSRDIYEIENVVPVVETQQ